MVFIMPAKPPILFPTQSRLLRELGERIRLARLRRKFSSMVVAERADISRVTLGKVEHGDPAVTMGTYLRVLAVLGLDKDFGLVAQDDELGRRLQDAEITVPKRAARRTTKRKMDPEAE